MPVARVSAAGDATSAEPSLHRARANDCTLAYYERHPELRGQGPTLFFTHGTGFHARTWDQVIARLPAVHSIAVDSRGHGQSEDLRTDHWRTVGEDFAALLAFLDLENVLGVGHSMGAHAMIDAAASCEARFRRLVLVDPTVLAPDVYAHAVAPAVGAQHPVEKRRNRFASVETMVERLESRSSFPRFDPQAFRDYCQHGLVPAEDGDGLVLACPPEIEASVYLSGHSNGRIYESVRALTLPVLILRAQEPRDDLVGPLMFSASPTWPRLVGEFRDAREIHFADKTHYLPMEIPGELAGLIRGELALVEDAESPGGEGARR